MACFELGLVFGFMLLCGMAKELTHIMVARNVLKRLEEARCRNLAQILKENLSSFCLGAIIPDAFLYDLTPFRQVSRHYAHLCRALHSNKRTANDQKAVGFFDAIRVNPDQWQTKTAFAAGIVTHTVTDRIIHGIIDHYTTNWDEKGSLALATHRQLETLIDMVLLDQIGLHPRRFEPEALLDVDKTTEACLLRFYLYQLMGPFKPNLLNALTRAYAQQRIMLKLFTLKPLYHIVNFLDKPAAGRLLALSNLFYPEAVGSRDFPILDKLDLNALTDGHSFAGTVASLLQEITTDATSHIRIGIDRLSL